MAAEPLDLLVIGGGITGAGIARDAALRGIRTALVDKGDFGAATSSSSSRLIHGGLRYLEQGEYGLVREASRERRVLLRIAPHLVRPLAFLFPVYRGSRVSPWRLRAGMWLYDVLASFRNIRNHRWLGPRAVRRLEPTLKSQDLRGATLYYDAQTDDARLVLATIRSAARAGALVANYAEALSLTRPAGRVSGAVIRDGLTGETRSVRALVVVNATGPWTDHLRRLDDPSAVPLLRLTKGVHVAVPRARLSHSHAITMLSPLDGRVMFVLPWDDLSYVGTTDTDEPGSPDDVRVTQADQVYLLRSANAMFPDARLGPADIVSSWGGLRPLLAPDHSMAASAVSREHRIEVSASGLITIAGGKLTTYRLMARQIVDRVAQRLRELDGRPLPPAQPTELLPLLGGESADLDVLIETVRRRDFPEPIARHLVAHYGSEAAGVLNRVDGHPDLARPLVAGRPEIWAEVPHAVEREMAVRLTDFLMRRVHLYYEMADHGLHIAPAVARHMGRLLGWNEQREAEEIASYEAAIARLRPSS